MQPLILLRRAKKSWLPSSFQTLVPSSSLCWTLQASAVIASKALLGPPLCRSFGVAECASQKAKRKTSKSSGWNLQRRNHLAAAPNTPLLGHRSKPSLVFIFSWDISLSFCAYFGIGHHRHLLSFSITYISYHQSSLCMSRSSPISSFLPSRLRFLASSLSFFRFKGFDVAIKSVASSSSAPLGANR